MSLLSSPQPRHATVLPGWRWGSVCHTVKSRLPRRPPVMATVKCGPEGALRCRGADASSVTCPGVERAVAGLGLTLFWLAISLGRLGDCAEALAWTDQAFRIADAVKGPQEGG